MCDNMSGGDENNVPVRDNLIVQPIEKVMSRSYIDYSMSVIVGRALPDVRDGLKPVHRRILYAMNDLGIPYNKPHKKSARIVGEVLGKYHPHGVDAAYGAMVRLAQPFSLRYPLVDGQGNFGSVDGDPAAAMRYTEARLAKLSSDLLMDLEKETVDFVDNFDGTLKEPVVLPSKFPNLLVNGSSGIAVGMATNMPPHNLIEVVDAINYTIDNPDAEISDIMGFIKGPDFPTGGLIYGRSGIESAYKTGRGRIKVRSKTHFEENNGKVMIVVDEIPYKVNKEKLILQIADCVKSKKIEGITNINDESDKDGMRIVIEIYKNESVVLENLFKHTQMETTFGVINLVLVNNKPVLLTLKELIVHYINHRREVVKRRTKFDLDVAKKRYHILEGLMAAAGRMEEVIKLIRASETAEKANIELQKLLSIDADQAKAILDLRLHKLTSLEIDSIANEYDNLKKVMIDLQDILDHEERVSQIIKDELTEMKENYGDARRTTFDPNNISVDEEDLIPREDVVIMITNDNYIKRIPLETYKQQRRGGTGLIGMGMKEEDDLNNMFVTCTHDYILFITNLGRLYWLKGYNVPEGSRYAKGKPIINMVPGLEEGEKVVNTITTANFLHDKYLLFCTKKGLVKKTALSMYSNVRKKGIKAIKLNEDDEVISIGITDGSDEIIIATDKGKAVRFSESEIRPMGRNTTGVKGVTLANDSVSVGMAIVKQDDMILTVSENGFGKISNVDEYRKTHRGSQGVITIKTTDRNGLAVAVKKVHLTDELIVTSKQGKVLRTRVSDIRVTGRNVAGVKIMDMRNNDKIVALQSITQTDDEVSNPDPES